MHYTCVCNKNLVFFMRKSHPQLKIALFTCFYCLLNRGVSLNLSRWHHKLMNISFSKITVNVHHFFKKTRYFWRICLSTSERCSEMIWKSFSKNLPVVKLVKAIEPGQPTIYQIIWYKKIRIVKLLLRLFINILTQRN